MMRNIIISIAVILGINNSANAFVLNIANNTDDTVKVITIFGMMRPLEIKPREKAVVQLPSEQDEQTGGDVTKQLRQDDINVITEKNMNIYQAMKLGKIHFIKPDVVQTINNSIAAKEKKYTVNFPEEFTNVR